VLFPNSKNKVPAVKTAPCLKAPYVTDKLNILESYCDPHNMLYNTIYYITKKHYKTYFYHKNNLAKYYNENTLKRNTFIVLDLKNDVYTPIKFNKLKHKIDDYISFIIKTEDEKWYIITENTTCSDGKNCIAIINAQNGQELYTANRINALYELTLYSIANTVIPIIQVKKAELYVYLFDLVTGKCHKSYLDLDTLKSLVLKLLLNSQEYSHMNNDIIRNAIKEITIFRISRVHYNNKINENGTNYINEIMVKAQIVLWDHVHYYEYCLENLILKMTFENNKIKLYINLEEAYVYIEKRTENAQMPMVYFKNYTNKLSIEWDKYKINKVYNSIYYMNRLYMDNCYHIFGYENGIVVLDRQKHSWGLTDRYLASMHRYKKYLFIINEQPDTKLTIIDLERKSIGVWSSENSEYSCLNYRAIYEEYYSEKSNKMVFVSHNSNCLFLIDLQRIDNFFNSKMGAKCEQSGYHKGETMEINEIIHEIELSDLIKNAIMKAHGNNGSIMSINPLGHYIDKKHDSVYFAFQYKMSYKHKKSEDYIGIFVCRIIDGRFYCKLIKNKYVSNIDSKNLISVYNRKNNIKRANYPISISNIEPYMINNVKSNRINNLDIAYMSDNRGCYFISFKHNRISFELLQEPKNDKDSNIEYHVMHSGNMIWIKEKSIEDEYNIFCFIVNDIFIIRQMEIVNI
jgi:hypothetical protein